MNNGVVTSRLHFVFSGLGDALADESKKKCVGIVSFLSLSLFFFFFRASYYVCFLCVRVLSASFQDFFIFSVERLLDGEKAIVQNCTTPFFFFVVVFVAATGKFVLIYLSV